MAFSGKVIHNSKTGQEIRFLQTANDTEGRLLEMETIYHAHSKEPPLHYHPYQVEDFTVLAGELSVRMNGEIKRLRQGDLLQIPVGKAHSMWNQSGSKTIVQWKVQPAMDTEYLLETGVGLANDNKTNENGMPGILQVALMAQRFSTVFRLAKPPFIVQRIVFALLAPIAYVRGYRATYKKYLD